VFKDAVITKAKEIDRLLGKSSGKRKITRYDTSLTLNEEVSSAKGSDSPLQILGAYDLKFDRFEIILEGVSHLKLASKAVDKRTHDVIFLSTKQSEQFNRKLAEPDPFKELWKYSIVAKNFSLGYTYRKFDDDKTISLRTILIEDKTYEGSEHKLRFPILMKIDSHQRHQSSLSLPP